MEIGGLAHIGIFVKDNQVSAKFYQDILGFTEIWRNKNWSEDGEIDVIFIENDGLIIELVQFPKYEQRKDGLIDHIAFKVKNIDEVITKLKENGVVFEENTHTTALQVFEKGSRWIMFRGPDGEHLELNERL
ncbi:hypothetical protein EII17_00860 [Clostridiales bacterium COT073_COT-073]|nr:hypothetical protein EII17_00860 [Clostridiales bacterium COT073_COT-073]